MTTATAIELTATQLFPGRVFATLAELRLFIRAIPGYQCAKVLAFPTQRQQDRYAPRGANVQSGAYRIKNALAQGSSIYFCSIIL